MAVKYKDITMSKGNLKLSKDILIWNIPAVKTCPNCSDCWKKCYARKAEKMYPSVLPCRERNYQASLKEDFVSNMVYLIRKTLKNAKKYKPKAIRIHESGDFYSREYAEKWKEIAKTFPELTFYGYTKAPENLPEDMPENMNIVHSILPKGEINFGSKEKVFRLAKKYHAKICPYGLSKKKFTCGKHCQACMKNSFVVFLEH